MKEELSPQITQVIKGGYCIGCGACAAMSGAFGMILDNKNDGAYLPDVSPNDDAIRGVSEVCPFSSEAENEDEIGRRLYGDGARHHTALGYYQSNYAGYVAEEDYRQKGSSGGMGSWILTELLNKGIADAILHVKGVDPDEHAGKLFSYGLSRTENEIRQGAKSRYYPITMEGVLSYVLENPGRYAIAGLPCFIKAVRRLSVLRPEFGDRIVCTVGLVCGHLKTTGFAESLAWQAGVAPKEIKSVDFRYKLERAPANKYGFMVCSKKEKDDVVVPMSKLFGGDWGMGFFKYKACEFCDDVTAETADISVGDAWLPGFRNDSRGTNVVIIRNKKIDGIVRDAIREKRLALSPLPAEHVADSQNAGLRHRREGLAYRLHFQDKRRVWRPKKRIGPSSKLTSIKKFIYIYRSYMSRKSITYFEYAKKVNDLSTFIKMMKVIVLPYKAVYKVIAIRGRLTRMQKKKS